MKHCSCCDTDRPEVDFYSTGRNRPRDALCKSCRRIKDREEYAAELPPDKRVKLDWKRGNRKEIVLSAPAATVDVALTPEQNLERKKAYRRAWQAAHPGYQAEKMREYWKQNREKMKALSRQAKTRRVLKANELKKKPCMDCHNRFHPEAMEYDHRNVVEKEVSPSAARWRNWDDYLAEIAKCDLVCANCHRVRTARRRQGLPAVLPEPEYFI